MEVVWILDRGSFSPMPFPFSAACRWEVRRFTREPSTFSTRVWFEKRTSFADCSVQENTNFLSKHANSNAIRPLSRPRLAARVSLMTLSFHARIREKWGCYADIRRTLMKILKISYEGPFESLGQDDSMNSWLLKTWKVRFSICFVLARPSRAITKSKTTWGNV